MAAEVKYVRIQQNGRMTLPADIRKRLGIRMGDYVVIEATPDGALISMPQAASALKALDQVGAAPREKGVTLEDWMESGREIREEVYREMYGHLEPRSS